METEQKVIFQLRSLKYVKDFKEKRPHILFSCHNRIVKLAWDAEEKVFLLEVENNG